MSQENMEIVRRAYEAFSRRDWEALFGNTHPDFLLQTELQGSYRGRKAAQAFVEDQVGAFDSTTTEPEEFFVSGDQVVVFVKQRARARGSNAEIEVKIGHLWTLRDGKIMLLHTFPQRRKALEAAGLEE